MARRKLTTWQAGCLVAFTAAAAISLGCSSLWAISTALPTNSLTPDPGQIGTIVVETALSMAQETKVSASLTAESTAAVPGTATFQAEIVEPANLPGTSCIPQNPPQTGKVVQVVDGDTIRVVLDQDGLTYTVRYIGMDTPENTSQIEYFGAEATAKNAELVNGKTVTLIKDVSETDRYGRLLRYALTDTSFVNYELVAQGYANTASYPPDVACISTFQAAEREAEANKLGMWASTPPQTIATLAPLPTVAAPGSRGTCNCSGPDLDCGDFGTHSAAQACFNYCRSAGFGDVFRLDGDDDGQACESLP